MDWVVQNVLSSNFENICLKVLKFLSWPDFFVLIHVWLFKFFKFPTS